MKEIPQETDGTDPSGEHVMLEVKAKFRRLSGAVRMIVPPHLANHSAGVNDVLVKALARGRRWYEMLVSGEVPSVHALARSAGLNERYVSRILRCAFLAPDLVKRITDGQQPRHLTLEDLLGGLQANWAQQRALFAEREG